MLKWLMTQAYLLIIDSTYQTPYLFKPFENGADIVVHSLTKWMAGHGSSMAGILVEGGKFEFLTK